MTIEAHLSAIDEKRVTLKQQIQEEMHRPMPNFQKIKDLKKQNLKLKEEALYCYLEQKRTASSSA